MEILSVFARVYCVFWIKERVYYYTSHIAVASAAHQKRIPFRTLRFIIFIIFFGNAEA